MREIKFRAWDKVYSHFHEGDILNDYVIGEFIRNPEYEVTQYTGLRDKNGVEIYEGDIITFNDEGEEGHEYREAYDFLNRAVVCFEDGRFELEKFASDNSGVLEEMNSAEHEVFIENFKNSQVIGNRFEHPELLEESP